MIEPEGKPVGNSRLPKALSALVLLLLTATQVGWTDRWMAENGFYARPMFSDAAGYRCTALDFKRALDREGAGAFFRSVISFEGYHAPLLFAWAAVVSYGDDGVDPRHAVFAIGALMLLFACGVYRLARHGAPRWAALLAAAFALSAPVIALNGRPLFPQFPMTACLAWAADALIRSQGLRRLKWSVLFGVWAGAALWMKNLAPLYVAGSSVLLLALGLLRPGERLRTAALAAAAFGAALLVAGPWYLPNISTVLQRVQEVSGDAGQTAWSRGVPLLSIERWLYYVRAFATGGVGAAGALLVVVAGATVVLRLLRKGGRPSYAALVLGADAVGAYLLLTIGQASGGAFYLTGVVAAAAALVAHQVGRARGIGRVVWIAATLFAIGWNVRLVDRPAFADDPTLFIAGVPLDPSADEVFCHVIKGFGLTARPEGEAWPAEEIARIAASPVRRRIPILLAPVNDEGPNPLCFHGTVSYETVRIGLPLEVVEPWSASKKRPEVAAQFFQEADWVLLEERWLPPELADRAAADMGVRFDRVWRREVTPQSSFSLAEIRPAWAPERCVGREALDDPAVRLLRAEFANGMVLEGVREVVGADGRAVFAAYWSLANGAVPTRALSVVGRTGAAAAAGESDMPVDFGGVAPEESPIRTGVARRFGPVQPGIEWDWTLWLRDLTGARVPVVGGDAAARGVVQLKITRRPPVR